MIPLYYGTIQDGKLHLTSNEKGLFRAYLDTLEGKEVQVAVEERKDQRTLNQNAYLWGVVCKLICDYTGDEPESFHEWAKDKFLGKKTVVIRGEERQVTRSTTELTKDEFFDVYVEPLRRWAAVELECVIPDPERVAA
jgi:hypothetical protein